MTREEELAAEVEELKKKIKKLQREDELTGLYNRNTFYRRVRKRLDADPDGKFVIVCFDIEKFKYINDRFGFLEGDRLLMYIGKKLRDRAEEYNLAAGRLSADVFSFMDREENINPKTIGNEIQSWVSAYALETDIKIAVGLYRVKIHSIPVRLMCDKANMAKDMAKNNYINNVAEYNKDISEYLWAQNDLLSDTDKAFADCEFKVYLQPKFDIRTNKIVGAESLVRWQHPKRGLIYPKDFIPLFEQNMLITKLDAYVWEQTCRLIRGWLDKGYTAVPVSVNVSRIDMLELDVAALFELFTKKYNIDRSLIEIEITESAFTSDEKRIIELVDNLRNIGFKVLMDDFGSGYSSLNILKDINVDVLKIDTRFLESGTDGNEKGREILESVIRMAKWIGLQTIAEGVETDEQRLFLMSLGCYYAQGFYFSRPISDEEFEEYIKEPNNVDTNPRSGEDGGKIAIEELFHSDFMTENLLNNILGGVAIYEFDGNRMWLLKANDIYRDITGSYSEEEDILALTHPSDREIVLEGIKAARRAKYEGHTIQIRRIHNGQTRWITARIYFLAERNGNEMYYTAVSDSTAQRNMANELDMSRRGFETALELIEAIVLEYNFETRCIEVKTKPEWSGAYIAGEILEDVPRSIMGSNLVHPAYKKAFINLCEHLRASTDPTHCTLALRYQCGVYRLCSVTAKTVYKNGRPMTSIIVIKSTGKNMD